MIGDLSGVKKIYLITGRTDLRKSIEGLMGIVKDVYDLDPYANAAFFFCGRRADRIKILHAEPDGMTLLMQEDTAGQGTDRRLLSYQDNSSGGYLRG